VHNDTGVHAIHTDGSQLFSGLIQQGRSLIVANLKGVSQTNGSNIDFHNISPLQVS
jgi:hypothetical protein